MKARLRSVMRMKAIKQTKPFQKETAMKLSLESGTLPLRFGIEKGYELIREAGFEGIDWSLDQAIPHKAISSLNYEGKCLFEKSLDELLSYYEPVLRALKENELSVCQAHAVFPSWVDGHAEVIDWAVRMDMRTIELCEAIHCPILIVHGISLKPGAEKKEQDNLNMRLFEPLAEFLKGKDMIVCLENLFTHDTSGYHEGTCSDPAEAAAYIDHLNQLAGRIAFALCFDTGHLNLLSKDVGQYVQTLGSRIRALHLHDNMRNRDAHMAPLTGNFEWEQLVVSLKAVGYHGDLSFETFAQTDRAYRFSPDLVLPYLKLINMFGQVMRKQFVENP